MASATYLDNNLFGHITLLIEDCSTSLFTVILVRGAPDPSRMALATCSIIKMSITSTADSILIDDLLKSLLQIQLSTSLNNTLHAISPAMCALSDSLANVQLHTPHNIPPSALVPSDSPIASMSDKHNTNVASKQALQGLTHIKDCILLFKKLLMALSKEQLGSVKAKLTCLHSIFLHITWNMTLVLMWKKEVEHQLQ